MGGGGLITRPTPTSQESLNPESFSISEYKRRSPQESSVTKFKPSPASFLLMPVMRRYYLLQGEHAEHKAERMLVDVGVVHSLFFHSHTKKKKCII